MDGLANKGPNRRFGRRHRCGYPRNLSAYDARAIINAAQTRDCLPARQKFGSAAPRARKAQLLSQSAHLRHAHTYTKVSRNHRPVDAGVGVVAARNVGSAIAGAGEFWTAPSHFLCRGRPGVGVAGNAHRELDGAAGC